MKRVILLISLMLTNIACNAQLSEKNKIEKNGVNVHWYFENDRIHFEMTAPTDGWVTIGFNTKSAMDGAYLLMGNVINNEVNLVEHYTSSSGNYKAITQHGADSKVENVQGFENGNSTTIKFSLPIRASSKYQRDLSVGMEYVMTIAYSQEDDFQHHSSMRTSVNVTL